MSLIARLEDELHDAMRQREGARRDALRLILSSLRSAEKELQRPLSDDEELQVLQRERKRRIEAAEAFRAGGREEQAQAEEDELAILQEFMPEPLSEDELERDRRRRDRRGRRDEHPPARARDGGRHAAGRRARRRLRCEPAGPRKTGLGRHGRGGRGQTAGPRWPHPPPRGDRSAEIDTRGAQNVTEAKRLRAYTGVVQEVVSVSNDVAAELAGVGDAVLDSLRDRLRCTILLRGNRLTIDGDRQHVAEARAVVDELVELVEGGHEIGPTTVDAVLGALDEAEDIRDVFEEVVWRHRGKTIAPKTVMQKRYVDAIRQHTVTFAIGPAGTGKTYLAMALAVAALSEREVGRIILTRPAVEAGERLGFLPGDMLAKVDPYLRPLYDALYDMLDADRLAAYMEKGTIEVAPLAFMRGRTLNDSFIILDEAQNTSPEQMQMFLTRLGFGSKVVVTGDVTQIDLPRDQASGLIQVQNILGSIEGIGFIQFSHKDVVRHKLVQRIVEAYKRHAEETGHATPHLVHGRGRGREPERAGRRRGGGCRPGPPGARRRRDRGRRDRGRVRDAGGDAGAEARAPGHRRGDGRALVPDRRPRRAARRGAPPARRRGALPADRRRRLAGAARARPPPSARVRPRAEMERREARWRS